MPHQTTYLDNLASAVEGQQAHTERNIVISRNVALAAIGFGKVAVQGATDGAVRAPASGETKFVGITVIDQAVDPSSPDEYPVGASAGVLRSGSVWVKVGEAVTAGDPAYFVPASGAIMKTASGNTLIPGGRFDTSAALNGLALLYIA